MNAKHNATLEQKRTKLGERLAQKDVESATTCEDRRKREEKVFIERLND
jgi:hypothetical protein